MNRQQAAEILAVLTEAFRADVTPVEATIWCAELCRLDADTAEAAARQIIRDSEFFPTIARLLAAYGAERRARAAKQPGLPQSAEVVDPAEFQAGLDAARASLRRRP